MKFLSYRKTVKFSLLVLNIEHENASIVLICVSDVCIPKFENEKLYKYILHEIEKDTLN